MGLTGEVGWGAEAEAQKKDDNRFPLSFPPHAFFPFHPLSPFAALLPPFFFPFAGSAPKCARVNATHSGDRWISWLCGTVFQLRKFHIFFFGGVIMSAFTSQPYSYVALVIFQQFTCSTRYSFQLFCLRPNFAKCLLVH